MKSTRRSETDISDLCFARFDAMVEQGARYAVFDLDGTILRSNIVMPYVYVRRRMMHPCLFWFWFVGYLVYAGIYYRWLDARSRLLFQKRFFRRYERLPYDGVCRWSARYAQTALQHRSIVPVRELLDHLKSRGVAVSILSTGITPVVEPIAAALGVSCNCIEVKNVNGRCEVSLEALEGFKERIIEAFDPACTIAVADSRHDLPILQRVRFPVVVAGKYRAWMGQVSDAIWIKP